jgi:hypothetical protein
VVLYVSGGNTQVSDFAAISQRFRSDFTSTVLWSRSIERAFESIRGQLRGNRAVTLQRLCCGFEAIVRYFESVLGEIARRSQRLQRDCAAIANRSKGEVAEISTIAQLFRSGCRLISSDFAANAKRSRIYRSMIVLRFYSDCEAIAKRLRRDCAVFPQRSHSGCAAILHRFHSDLALIVHRLRIDCEAIAKRLQSDIASIAQ